MSEQTPEQPPVWPEWQGLANRCSRRSETGQRCIVPTGTGHDGPHFFDDPDLPHVEPDPAPETLGVAPGQWQVASAIPPRRTERGAAMSDRCPECGCCPTCGRGDATPYETHPQPYVWPPPSWYGRPDYLYGYGRSPYLSSAVGAGYWFPQPTSVVYPTAAGAGRPEQPLPAASFPIAWLEANYKAEEPAPGVDVPPVD